VGNPRCQIHTLVNWLLLLTWKVLTSVTIFMQQNYCLHQKCEEEL
jgi:hypothetical protein